jgi:hypothetical protein
MKGAEFIGIDAINENLKDFKFDAIGVYQGKLEKFKRTSNEDETEEDLILYFNQWCERMIASNPTNFQHYSIQLYDLPDGGKKLVGSTSFTFQLNDKPVRQLSGDDSVKNNGSISKRELELALENQRLEFEKHLLERELADNDDDFDDDDDKNVGMIGAIQQTVMQKLPALIDILIMQMQPKQNTIMPSGIGSNVDEIITEFRKINPSIESDLQKLLDLAKTKPDLFKMLITQLRSM